MRNVNKKIHIDGKSGREITRNLSHLSLHPHIHTRRVTEVDNGTEELDLQVRFDKFDYVTE